MCVGGFARVCGGVHAVCVCGVLAVFVCVCGGGCERVCVCVWCARSVCVCVWWEGVCVCVCVCRGCVHAV